MSAFETFVNLELPRRSAHLTVAITGYDGDPNDGGAPAILQNSPQGTWYQRETPEVIWYRKQVGGIGGATSWVIPGGTLSTPGTTTDNAVVRWDGVDGGAIQNSGVTVSDTDDLNVPGELLSPGTGGVTSFKAGPSAGAGGTGSVALGRNAVAISAGSIAIGDGATFEALVDTTNCIAIGTGALCNVYSTGPDLNQIAIGTGATTQGSGAIAIGNGALANTASSTDDSVAIGNTASARYDESVAIGSAAQVNNARGIAIGRFATGSLEGVAIGNSTNCFGGNAVCVGHNADARADCVAVGHSAVTDLSYGVAIGKSSRTKTNSVAIGWTAGSGHSVAQQAIAVGYQAKAYTDSIAIGYNANYRAVGDSFNTWTSSQSIVIGTSAVTGESPALGQVVIGHTASSVPDYGIALGHSASVPAGATSSIALGRSATVGAAGTNAISIGYLGSSAASGSVVIGYNASSLSAAVQGVAIGQEATASQAYGVGIGYQSDAQQWGVAIGYSTYAGSACVSIGYDTVTASNGIAIGYLATAPVGGVVLGWSATGLNSNNVAVGFRAKSGTSTVSIGAAVCYDNALPSDARQLTNSVMIGASATGTNLKTECVAVGYTALVEDDRATAIGSQSDVGSADAIAIGYTADVSTTAVGAVAIGSAATVGASSGGSIAIGQSTSAAGADSVVIGNAATSGDVDNVVVGANASASGFRNVAIGEAAVGGNDAGDLYNVSIGWSSSCVGDESVAVGAQASVDTLGIAIGYQAINTAGAVCIGRSSNTNGASAVAIGQAAAAIGGSGVAVGTLARTQVDSVSIGFQTRSHDYSVCIGRQAGYDAASTNTTRDSQRSVLIGWQANAEDLTTGCISIGYTADIGVSDYAIAIGYAASIGASNDNSIAIGASSSVTSDQCVVVGNSASTTQSQSVCIGYLAAVTGGLRPVTIGYGSVNTGGVVIGGLADVQANAVAIGDDASAWSECISIGRSTRTTGGSGEFRSVAIGERATAYRSSVAVGWRAGFDGAAVDVRSSVFIGAESWGTVNQTGAIGIGYQSRANSAYSIAIGYQTSIATSRNDAISIGRATIATGPTAIALGYATTAAEKGVAIGDQADSAGLYAVSIGYLSAATTSGIAIGRQPSAAASNGIAIGGFTEADFSRAIAIGDSTVAVSAQCVGVGALSRVGGNAAGLGFQIRAHTDAVAIGYQAGYDTAYTNQTPLAADAVMIGRQALAADGKTGAIAIGRQSQSMANYSIAIGHSAEVLSDLIYQPTNTVGIGYNIAIAPQSEYSVYIGDNVQAIDTKGVAATGSITVVAGSLLIDGETVVLSDGTNPSVTFEFDSDGSVVETNTLRAVNFTAGDTANTVAGALFAAIFNAPVLDITPVNAAPTVNLTNDRKYFAGNQTITDTVADGGFTTTGMSGGANQAWTGENVGIGSGVTMKGGGNVCIGTWSVMGAGEAYGVTMVGYNIDADYSANDYSTLIGSEISSAVDCSDNVCIGTGQNLQSGCAFNTTVGPYNYFGAADCGNNVVLSWNGGVGDSKSGAVTNSIVLGYNARAFHDFAACIGTNMPTQRDNLCTIGPQATTQYMDLQCSGAIRSGGNPFVAGALQVGDERIVQNFQGTATTGGSLVSGSHFYYISATLPTGESYRTTATVSVFINPPTTNRAALSWDPFPGATGYTIYARGGTFGSTYYKRSVTGTAFDHDDYVTGWTATSERFQGSGDFLSTADAVRFTANTPDSFFGLFCNNGVGTDSPTEKLDVAGTLKVRGDAINNGQETLVKTVTTVLSSLSGATATATNLIPAGAVVVGVTTRVTSAVSGATSFDVGDGTDVDAFGAAIAVALDTTSDNTDWTITSIPIYPTATSVVLTANGSSFTGGIVRVSVHYIAVTAPTS